MRIINPTKKVKIITIGLLLMILLTLCKIYFESEPNILNETRNSLRRDEEDSLAAAVLNEKGTGCDIPSVDAFENNPIATFEGGFRRKPRCPKLDWVQCYLSTCKVVDEILSMMHDLVCTYRDLIFVDDWNSKLGKPVTLKNNAIYILRRSDHVKVNCTAMHKQLLIHLRWVGHKAGYRKLKKPIIPKDREKYPNILLFAFDSTSKNGFIRKMPKSFKVLVDKYQSVVLNKYNIVGDGTVAALLGFLVGQTELELPELRKGFVGHTVDDIPIIFKILNKYGYRTAYFEDMPRIGTFQLRLKGFTRQPTDHYLRPFDRADQSQEFCAGDKLHCSFMIDLTRQYLKLPGQKFIFTFVVDITHDDSVKMKWADNDFSKFLLDMLEDGILNNTAVFVLGDHGPRYSNFRALYEGKIEERLPFMAIRLPDALHSGAENVALNANKDTLTTPFDIHTTLLHLTGLEQYKNEYKVPGADMPRGHNLLEVISPNRSCAEAGVLAHWCVCLKWRRLVDTDPMYQRVATAFLLYVNMLTAMQRQKCSIRTITSVKWVAIKQHRNDMFQFVQSADRDGYVSNLNEKLHPMLEFYQIQVLLGPGTALYEASATYSLDTKKLHFNERDISRINKYGDEPNCIRETHPDLMKYCYCNSYEVNVQSRKGS